MKSRTVLLTGCGILLAVIVTDAAVGLISRSEAIAGPLDLTQVSSVDVTGKASHIIITADPDAPQTALLQGRRDGWSAVWRSGWFFSDTCTPDASMRTDGNRLIVDMGRSPRLFDWSDCQPTLTANIKPDSAISVDQAASRTELEGDFSTVNVASDAGDVVFDGHATGLSLSGAALRARIIYRHVANDETIQLFGKMMDASLRFVQPTEISYLVEAVASLVDSDLPNTPGAKPAVTVRGDMLRLHIE
ncbi:hypothetical protein ACQQ2Q_02500 [Agrobacterium sp. ES01]|uniref:hypothetical protein n=1 Tax=Agrobacterium sp. ES01 TaxID=3420714 RepID=UPI003D141B88